MGHLERTVAHGDVTHWHFCGNIRYLVAIGGIRDTLGRFRRLPKDKAIKRQFPANPQLFCLPRR